MRIDFRERYSPENIGIRTRRVVELLSKEIVAQDPSLEDEAVDIALAVFDAVNIKIEKLKPKKDEVATVSDMVSRYLLFLSSAQIEAAASRAIEVFHDGGLESVKKAKKELKQDLKADLSVDLALFGRMVAEDADLNVEASCQVAHALSTHHVGTEFDFFTAVDDAKVENDEESDAGAGMMGTVEFDAGTFYRYATVNASALAKQLGSDEAAARAIEGFVDVFATSLPTGKQNTFAAHSLPSTIVVSVRTDRPVSWMGAFERPVYPTKHVDGPVEGYDAESSRKMLTYAESLNQAYGDPAGPNLILTIHSDADTGDLSDSLVSASNLRDLQERTAAAVVSALEDA